MHPEQWQQIDQLFHAALERAPHERAAWLATVSNGDVELQREVATLLAAHEQPGEVWAVSASDLAAEWLNEQPPAPSLSGRQISHYQIESLLGQGGMGEVWRAHDTHLNRAVAFKVLPAEFAQDADRLRRFEREAQAISALNHPNIITIHEIGQQDEQHFIITEFIDGESLRQHLHNTRLSSREAIDIAIQIASALAAAHQAGVVHRDIKPENVMIRSDELVKVLDFGLAKLTGGRKSEVGTRNEEVDTLLQGSPDLHRSSFRVHPSTMPGMILGTTSYMSPEQARGLGVDARSDIWSLGCVLYEMVTGRRAFEGATTSDTIAAILQNEPPPAAPTLPAELEIIVRKALRKECAARYQTVKDMASDLKRLHRRLEFEVEAQRHSSDVRAVLGTARRLPLAANTFSEAPTLITDPSAGETFTAHTTLEDAQHLGTRTPRVPLMRTHAAAGLLVLAALVLVVVAVFFAFNRKPVLTDKDTILLTDFVNTAGDPVFDSTLKQALAVHLGQSPFLNIFPDQGVRETLRLMNRAPEERVTPTLGREICQRQGLKAMLTGSIASLGHNYVISLEAVNGQSGEVLAREQTEAEGKEQVLRNLGQAASRLREKLGESLSSIKQFDAPLEQVTTDSLAALKAYSLGWEEGAKGKPAEAIPFLKHAVELDPNFARAYSILATAYGNSGQPGLAAEAAQKAFALRERVSEREKFHSTSNYSRYVTGEVHKAIEVLELCKQTYPRDADARNNLGARYNIIGQSEQASVELREAIRLNPNVAMPYGNLAIAFRRLNRFAEAQAIGEQAVTQKLAGVDIHSGLFNLALIHQDAAAMQQHINWASARPGEYVQLTWQAGAAAFVGQWRKAQEYYQHAIALAEQGNLPEVAGELVSLQAENAAVLGQCRQSRADLARAAAWPRNSTSLFRASMALALCGAAAQAQELNDEAVKRYPQNTVVNEINLPLLRAALELQHGNRTQAIQMLPAASRYEGVSYYYQNYLRGQAYLGEGQGAAAAREFQTILAHRGWFPASLLYPLAHLGLARAAVLQGDPAQARQSYQDFLALWKEADADLPLLIAAKKEYEKVK